MNPFEMVVAIVLVVTFGRVLQAKFAAQRSANESLPVTDDRHREEIRALKERLAVLERLATENNSSIRLDREIEKLRDHH